MTDHEATLRAAQADVDRARAMLDAALAERAIVIARARADQVTIYRIAQVLGVRQNAVRQSLARTDQLVAAGRRSEGVATSA